MKSEKFLLYVIIASMAVFTFMFSFFAVNTSLHFHFQQTAWNSGSLFLKYFIAFSGGLGEYFTLFISQFFRFNILGSAIVALSGVLTTFFIYKTIYLKWTNLKLLILIIPLVQIIVLTLMFDYRYHFSVTVNLLIVSGFLFLCTAIDNKTSINISLTTIFASILIYYICGGMFFLIFIISSLILLLKRPDFKMLINVLAILATALIVPLIANSFIFLSSLNNSFFRSTPDVAAMLRYGRPILFYVFLAAIPTIFLLAKISSLFPVQDRKSHKTKKPEGKTDYKSQQKHSHNSGKHKFAAATFFFLLISVSGYIIYRTYKPDEKTKVEIDYYAYQQNWEKVLELSKKLGSYDRMVNFQYNRALLNNGQVLEKLFEYEQLLGSQGMFLDRPFTSEVALPNSDIYFDLGNIDESQRYAFESETLMKNSPRVLKRLVLNCIILDKLNAANTYINILAANPTEKEWVMKYREIISNPNQADSDSLILNKRKDMSKTEGLYGTPPLKLINQLKKNPMNKTAFEYLIALDLMEHDLVSLEEDMKYISRFNYKNLPVVLEEALILFRAQGKTSAYLSNIKISETTTERFRQFAKLTSAAKGDKEKAKQATSAYSNTYWYYVLFLSPKVTNLKLETRPVEANY